MSDSKQIVMDRLKKIYEVISNIPKRTRSPVEYLNCTKRHRVDYPGTAAPSTAAAISDVDISPETGADDDDPDAELVNSDDPDAEMVIGDDPDDGILPATANGDDDPDAETMIGDDPDDGILPATANGGDPDDETMIGDDPGDGIPPALANGDNDPDAETMIGDDPDDGIPPAPANGEEPAIEIENGGEEMPAEMREHIIERMGGYRLQMIIEKRLTATDMRTDQGRLALPTKMVRVEFLTVAEERYLNRRGGGGGGDGEVGNNNGLNFMDIFIVGPDLTESPIRMKKWLIGSRLTNCLMNKWNSFVTTYELKVRDTVRIWSFRVDRRDDETNVVKSELRFALIKL